MENGTFTTVIFKEMQTLISTLSHIIQWDWHNMAHSLIRVKRVNVELTPKKIFIFLRLRSIMKDFWFFSYKYIIADSLIEKVGSKEVLALWVNFAYIYFFSPTLAHNSIFQAH